MTKRLFQHSFSARLRRFRSWSRTAGIGLCLVALMQSSVPVRACGPELLEPIFVFKESPDLPFDDFVKGNIGIIRPSMGRKTLVIAHRYLNGGSFTGDEQSLLIAALRPKSADGVETEAAKTWIAARKEVSLSTEKAPAIYEERRYGGYDFFPNCTADAFNVAAQTLKDRASSYGNDNSYVQSWLSGQDIVFRNCGEGALVPPPAEPGSPPWFQKDRDYQIAAASFYSLNFPDAEQRFRAIAQDVESVWQETAQYLVGRTLVRAASLSDDPKVQVAKYQQAEGELYYLANGFGKYRNAARRLVGLIKYRLRPEERVSELASILDRESGNNNVGQDLIDYTWLLDKFEAQAQKEEEERQKAANPEKPAPTTESYQPDPKEVAERQALERGELISFYFYVKGADGEPDYSRSTNFVFKPDVTEIEVVQSVESSLGQTLTEGEIAELKLKRSEALTERQWKLSPNRKFSSSVDHESVCDYDCPKVKLSMFPEFIRAEELSDWVFTFENDELDSYRHAYSRWKTSGSEAWLMAALTKASISSRSLPTLMRAAERILPESPSFPSVLYQLVRLRTELHQPVEAKRLLSRLDVIEDQLPISAQNLFREQRTKLATTALEFLKFAPKKPVAFYKYGQASKLADLMQLEKTFWEPNENQTKEEFERSIEDEWRELIAWEGRYVFDEQSAEILNWHFTVQGLFDAARDPDLPAYLRKSLLPVVWTRAIILKNESVALSVAREAVELDPAWEGMFGEYLKARSVELRDTAALYILLKNPSLSPFVTASVPEQLSPEKLDYYFQSSWWCKPSDTVYDNDGNESPYVVRAPSFLSRDSVAAAKRERAKLLEAGHANRLLGKRTIAWAKSAPDDPRIPEALFIAIKANESYKYGCESWTVDEELLQELDSLLRKQYPNSPWILKLKTDSAEK